MVFSSQLPVVRLMELCRILRHNLGAGLTLVDVFQQQARRGAAAVRPLAARIAARLENGQGLEEALAPERAYFPEIFLDLAAVGEQTGSLPEIFGELEEYFTMQYQRGRQFRAQIILPLAIFFFAVFVIAAMLFILGAIADARGTQPSDPTGWGFAGKRGALMFLLVVFGGIAVLMGMYFVLKRTLRGNATVAEVLLRLPAIGPCLEAFALGRFTLALRLTLETGMPVTDALRLSLRATSNSAFVRRTVIILEGLRKGDDLAIALAKSRIFPEEFENIIAVAEESGRIPEVMRQQAKYYQEESGRRLTILTRVAGFGVWLLYVVFMVVAIMRIAGSYFRALG
jgi:type II secretory pathway component PulF